MPLVILTNTVWEDAARVVVTDVSYAQTADITGLQSITGGHNHYSWSQTGTDDRFITYVNKAGGIACNYVVVTRANAFNGHQVAITSYASYSGTAGTEFDSGTSFAETLTGLYGRDWVRALSVSGKEGIGINLTAGSGGNYAKTLYKVYFSTGFTLNYPGVEGSPAVVITPLPQHSRFFLQKQSFAVNERWVFTAHGLTRAEFQTFEQLAYLKTDAFFIYDSAGTLIPFKLLHCVLESYQVLGVFDNLFAIQFSVLQVEQ